jgi:hypothetical protein
MTVTPAIVLPKSDQAMRSARNEDYIASIDRAVSNAYSLLMRIGGVEVALLDNGAPNGTEALHFPTTPSSCSAPAGNGEGVLPLR